MSETPANRPAAAAPPAAINLRQVLQQVAARMSEFMQVERSTIFLYDPATDELWAPVAEGLHGTEEIRVKNGIGIAGAVMRDGAVLRIDDPYNDPRFLPDIDRRTGFRTRNLFCRPLDAPDGRRIGVIQLLNKEGGPLSSRDEKLLDVLCAQAAIALENAQLFQSLKVASDSERTLHVQLRDKHAALQKAFRELEQATAQRLLLEQRLRKVRWAAVAIVVGLFCALGWFVWRGTGRPAVAAPSSAPARALSWHSVATAPMSATITLRGNIEPLEIRHLSSPFRGRVAERNFQYGESVTEGQLLARIDPTELQVELRTATVAWIKARNELQRLRDWRQGPEVARAERSLLKARLGFEASQRNLRELEQLSSLGMIAASTLESARQRSVTEEADYKAVQEDHAQVLAAAGEERVTIARYDVENTGLRVQELEAKLERAAIHAPFSGIVILPNSRPSPNRNRGNDGFFEVGTSIDQGDVLLSLGDVAAVAIRTRVDEVDVVRVRHGQRVRISGDALQDTQLDGVVDYLSSQAIITSGRPYFELGVRSGSLTEAQRAAVRLGVTATLSIEVYAAPAAVVVPVRAVGVDAQGPFVWRRTGGDPERVAVRTGVVTPTVVEILSGLQPGDVVADEARPRQP